MIDCTGTSEVLRVLSRSFCSISAENHPRPKNGSLKVSRLFGTPPYPVLISELSSHGLPQRMATVSSSTSKQTRQSLLHCQDLAMGSVWSSTWSRTIMEGSLKLPAPGYFEFNLRFCMIQGYGSFTQHPTTHRGQWTYG